MLGFATPAPVAAPRTLQRSIVSEGDHGGSRAPSKGSSDGEGHVLMTVVNLEPPDHEPDDWLALVVCTWCSLAQRVFAV